jgi:peptide chain release factor 2
VKAVRLEEVTRELEDPKIWDDPKRAQELGKERKALEGVVGTLTTLDAGLRDSGELFELARADADDATLEAVATDVAAIEKSAGDLEFRRMFSDPMDPANFHRHQAVPAAPGAGLGRDVAADVPSLLRAQGLSDRAARGDTR